MRKFNKKQRIEIISMLNGDRDTRILGLQMCATYMEARPEDSKFKQLYHKTLRKDKSDRYRWIDYSEYLEFKVFTGLQMSNPNKLTNYKQ